MKQRLWIFVLLMLGAVTFNMQTYALKKLGTLKLADAGTERNQQQMPPSGQGQMTPPNGQAQMPSQGGQGQMMPPSGQGQMPSQNSQSQMMPPDNMQDSSMGDNDGYISDDGGNLKFGAPPSAGPPGSTQQNQIPPSQGGKSIDTTLDAPPPALKTN